MKRSLDFLGAACWIQKRISFSSIAILVSFWKWLVTPRGAYWVKILVMAETPRSIEWKDTVVCPLWCELKKSSKTSRNKNISVPFIPSSISHKHIILVNLNSQSLPPFLSSQKHHPLYEVELPCIRLSLSFNKYGLEIQDLRTLHDRILSAFTTSFLWS